MGSHTDLDQDNIMVADYGELPEADLQAFETQLEDLWRKMASCYRKTRQGVIKQEQFTLPVNFKSKILDSPLRHHTPVRPVCYRRQTQCIGRSDRYNTTGLTGGIDRFNWAGSTGQTAHNVFCRISSCFSRSYLSYDLAYSGLLEHLKEKLDGHTFRCKPITSKGSSSRKPS
uniref:Uncharacterized protein n=1 Tax=Oryza punctata TaxID=4537 RepID=A0A0E0MMJ7_ORYPU